MKLKVEYFKGQPKNLVQPRVGRSGRDGRGEKKKLSLGSIDRGAENLTNKVTKIKIT